VVGATRIELEATEPSWISIRGSDGTTQLARLIQPGNIQSVDIREPAVLRTGNAGGLTIRSNGKSLGPLGPHGVVREVEFKDGEFKLVPIK
jgi:cytoskeleton protein RodZ